MLLVFHLRHLLVIGFAMALSLTTFRQVQRITLFHDRWRRHPMPPFLQRATSFGGRLPLPSFTFFSHPPAFDLRIFARRIDHQGTYGKWTPVVYRHPGRVRMLWNPDRKRQKVVLEAAAQLLRDVSRHLKGDTRDPSNTAEYRLLVHAGARFCPFATGDVQFAICQVSIAHHLVPPRVLFLSRPQPAVPVS